MLQRAKSFLGRTKPKKDLDLSEYSHLRREIPITNDVLRKRQQEIKHSHGYLSTTSLDSSHKKQIIREEPPPDGHVVRSLEERILEELKIERIEEKQIGIGEEKSRKPRRAVQRSKSTMERVSSAKKFFIPKASQKQHPSGT